MARSRIDRAQDVYSRFNESSILGNPDLSNIRTPDFVPGNSTFDDLITVSDERSVPDDNYVSSAEQVLTTNASGFEETQNPIQPSNASGFEETQREAGNIANFIPKDNALSYYANYTYNFTLFLSNESYHDGVAGDPRNDTNKIILAQSGNSARFHLDDVSIENIVAPNLETKSMPITNVEFTIHEPKGLYFVDALFNASQELGVFNYIQAPYFLALEFVGYDDSGNPVLLEEFSHIWSLKIVNMQANTSEDGSVYNVTGIAYDDLASSNIASITKRTLNIKDVTSIEDFFKKFVEEYNKQLDEMAKESCLNPDQVEIELDKSFLGPKYKLKPTDNVKDPQLESDLKFFITDAKSVNIPPGTGLNEIVDSIFASSEEYVQEHMIDTENLGTGRADIRKTIKIPTIETQVELLGYDHLANNYVRKWIFKLKPYTTYKTITDPVASDADYNDTGKQESRFGTYNTELDIKKAYNYIYTGENTEVLSFDINLNYLWFAGTTIYAAIQSMVGFDDGSEYSELQKRLQFCARYKELNATQQQGDPLTSTPQEAAPLASDIARTGAEVDRVREDAFEPFTEERTAALAANASNKTRRITTGNFVESLDIDALSSRYRTQQESSSLIRRQAPIPTTVMIDPERPDLYANFLNTNTRKNYRSLAGAILANTRNMELVIADIEIRGDPFWIGVTNMEEKLANSGAEQIALSSNGELAEYITRDNLFLLRFRFPNQEDENTGMYNSASSDIYNGLYNVVKCTNKFNNGMFTQTLHAYKDNLTNTKIIGLS